jgi:Protein of unknown function (Hypoth_ymh)
MAARDLLSSRLDALRIQAISGDTFIDAVFGDDYNDIISKLLIDATDKSTYDEFALPASAWRQLASVGRQVNAKILRMKMAQLAATLHSSNRSLKVMKSPGTNQASPTSNDLLAFGDPELQARCHDLFDANDHFDRAVALATQIIESRIKSKLPDLGSMTGLPLANRAVNPEPSKALLKFSDNASEQEGYANLIKGIVGAYRNPTHHGIVEMTRQNAFQICGFIDSLLAAIGRAAVQQLP